MRTPSGKEHLGKCRLCQRETKLCNSHIIPEFLYYQTYDEKHRALLLSKGKSTYEQSGIKEYLLCNNCDNTVIGRWEEYSSPIVKSIQELKITQQESQYIVDGVRYNDFNLFQLSLLWRASIASVRMYESINIGEHEESIRKMLFSNNPGLPEQYGCMMFVLSETKNLHKTISSPVAGLIDGFTFYRFRTGRIFWCFFTSESCPKKYQLFLSREGILRIMKSSLDESTITKMLLGGIVDNPIE